MFLRSLKIIGLIVMLSAIAGVWVYRTTESKPKESSPSETVLHPTESPADVVQEVTLSDAIRSGQVRARFWCNGFNVLRMQLQNLQELSLRIQIPEGLVFEAGDNQVVTVRADSIELPFGTKSEQEIACAATSTGNYLQFQSYILTGGSISHLAVLLPFIQKNPELSLPAIQTAILVLTENPPLGTFAKFPMIVESSFLEANTDTYRVETRYILQALQMLQDIGYSYDSFAINVDPQLQAEAMVDPLTHASALKYYKIPHDKEYAYWQSLLTEGHPSLRHYALYGISRYFPDVALQMIPKWAEATSLDTSYRQAAIRSLAESPRIETVPVLQHLQWQLRNSSLENSVEETLQLVQDTLDNPYRFQLPILFRLTLPSLKRAAWTPLISESQPEQAASTP